MSKDPSVQTQDLIERLTRAAVDQLSDDGKITVEGVKNRSGVKATQTVQDHMEVVREAARQRNRFLIDAAESGDFPMGAWHEVVQWAITHALAHLGDREAALDAEADQLRQARADFKAEQEDLRLANKQATQRADEEERRRIQAEKEHQAAADQWDRALKGATSQLEEARNQIAELEGRHQADASELDRLGTENKVLQSQVAELDDTQAEVERLTKAGEVAKAEYDRLDDRLAEVKARLAEAEQGHQKREASWLTERDALKEQIQELKATVKIEEGRLADRTEVVEKLGKERDTLQAELKGLSETAHARAIEVATVTAQRDGLAEDKAMLTQQVERLTAELTKLNRHNSLLTNKLEAMHTQLEGKRPGK